MDPIINAVLLACVYPVLPIMYFILRNESRPKKNVILGVTVPLDHREDAGVAAICKGYRRALAAASAALAVVPAAAFLTGSFSAALTLLLSWLLAAIVAPFLVYAAYHRRLRALKGAGGWRSGSDGALMVDTKVSVAPMEPVAKWLFAIPVAVSLAPVTHAALSGAEPYMVALYGTMALLVILFCALNGIFYSQRSEMVDGDTTLTMALTAIRRRNWHRLWLMMAWLTGLYNVGLWAVGGGAAGILIVTAAYAAALIIFSVMIEFRVRGFQERLTAESGKGSYVDSDAHWIVGMFYHNPNDRRLIVNSRIGVNATVNLAKPVGMVIMAVSVIALLAMPFFGLWLMAEEATPIRVELHAQALSVHHTGKVFELAYGEVEEVAVMESLPAASKVWGTNLGTLYKGRFEVAGIGGATLCLNPKAPPYILLRAGGESYLFNLGDDSGTRGLASAIEAALGGAPPR